MSSQCVAKFVAVIAPYFPTPRFESEEDSKLWLAVLTKAIGGYGPEAIAKAAEAVVFTRDRKKDGAFFPTPRECIAACEKAKRALELETIGRAMLTVDKEPSGFNPDRHKLALDCLATELGIEAVKARWHGALYDFIYRNARMPRGTEVDAVKAASRAFFDEVAACERGERGELSPGLAKLGRGIAMRREKYAQSIE